MNIAGKTVIVTGSGRGIGKSIAEKFAKMGANVILNGTSDSVDDVARQLLEQGFLNVAVEKCDVREYDNCVNLINKALETFGTVDILVNNAGITRDGFIMRMSEKDWDDVIDVNLKGAFNCIKAVSRPMIKQASGKIINISSVVGITGNTGQANYAASKAGIIGLTKSIAKELATKNITVNAVAPGLIQTDMTDKLSDSIKDNYLAAIPLRRFGNTEDVANVVAFLASGYADYITGQVINVDGGMVM